MAYPVPAPYSSVIRTGGYGLRYTVDAWFDGAPVAGAQELEPVGGGITDTNRPGVRRNLSLTLAPIPGLYDLLAPLGAQLKVFSHFTYTNRTEVTIPMGVFVVSKPRITTGGGNISIAAPDKWRRIQLAKFIGPRNSTPGMAVTAQIAELIEEALPGETVTITATSSASVGALTWEQDREKAILDMAASIGAWVYFDRDGAPIVADIPTPGATADWLVDASPTGVLLGLDREQSDEDTFNVVVATSTAADAEKFPPQVAFDSNPLSPTYAGTDPFAAPETAGPFGIRVKYLDTPTDTDAAGALAAAQAELTRSVALAQQVSLEQAPNPAADAYDVIDVLPLAERRDLGATTERHVADTLTHPLVVADDQGLQIDARKVSYA